MGSIPGREDPLEKEMETQSSILAWRIPWTEEPGGLQIKSKRAGHHLQLNNKSNASISCVDVPEFIYPLTTGSLWGCFQFGKMMK